MNNLENLQEAENILIQKSVEIGASYKENVNPFDTMDEFVGANIDPECKESRTMLDELLFDPGL